MLGEDQQTIGSGCQQLLVLKAGSYLLAVRAPRDGRAQRFKPVLLGLEGRERGVPDAYLNEFFRRIEGGQEGGGEE